MAVYFIKFSCVFIERYTNYALLRGAAIESRVIVQKCKEEQWRRPKRLLLVISEVSSRRRRSPHDLERSSAEHHVLLETFARRNFPTFQIVAAESQCNNCDCCRLERFRAVLFKKKNLVSGRRWCWSSSGGYIRYVDHRWRKALFQINLVI